MGHYHMLRVVKVPVHLLSNLAGSINKAGAIPAKMVKFR
jgi:hypothetical protein